MPVKGRGRGVATTVKPLNALFSLLILPSHGRAIRQIQRGRVPRWGSAELRRWRVARQWRAQYRRASRARRFCVSDLKSTYVERKRQTEPRAKPAASALKPNMCPRDTRPREWREREASSSRHPLVREPTSIRRRYRHTTRADGPTHARAAAERPRAPCLRALERELLRRAQARQCT